MADHPLVRRSGMKAMAPDPARMRRSLSVPQRNFLNYGTVGHVDPITGLPEPNPAFIRIERGQIYVEVTLQPDGDQIVARYGMDGAGEGVGEYSSVGFGCRVLVEMIKGNPQNAVITATMNDANCRFPDSVAGVQTGAALATVPGVGIPGPLWRFIKLGPGQLMAIETQVGGDILIHSAGSTHFKAGVAGAHHLEGRVALGEGPTTPPVGATVGPAGTTIPGVPAVPNIPIPAVPSIPATPLTIVPYIGFNDGVIRSKDAVQSHAGVDPSFWAYMIGLYAHPLIGPILASSGIVLPIALHSEHGGRNGPGSQHTASD